MRIMNINKVVLATVLFVWVNIIICSTCNAYVGVQYTDKKENDSTEIFEKLCVNVKSQTEWLERYSSDMEAFRLKDDSVKDFNCDAIFVGSSSIRLWPELMHSMSPLKVVNRGYGGATMRDLFLNYETVFSSYLPKAVVFYCDNDICGWKEGDLTVGEVFDLYRVFLNKVHKDYPEASIYFLSIKHSVSRANLRDKQHTLNLLMQEYAKLTTYLTYVDVCSPLLDNDGNIRSELFQGDNLHLNKEGYSIWVKILKPLLLEKCK